MGWEIVEDKPKKSGGWQVVGDVFDQINPASGTGDIFDQINPAQSTPKFVPVDHDPFASGAGIDASKVSFGTPKMGKPVDTRKISYTDPGFTPNKPASQYTDADFANTGAAGIPISPKVKGFVKNFTQDVMEAPQFPVKAAAGIVNSPDTVKAGIDLGKSMVTTPLGFVPGVSEMATGKSATENWETNPGVGAMLAVPAIKGGKAVVQGGVGKIADMIAGPDINQTVTIGMEKGVRPSTQGMNTFEQQQAYMGKATDAVKTIIENRDKLNLTDEFGEPIADLPQNLKQFSQAISQTKQHIYDQYNRLAESAGEQGATIPLDAAVSELQNFAKTKGVVDFSPDLSKYADDLASRLSERGAYTAPEAQAAVQQLNSSLEAFYKNPSYESASRAGVDSMVVNHIRKALDSAIDQSTGEAYQPLKNQYGALRAIERDVNQRALVDARKNAKGLIDFSDIYTAGELVHGILTGNPALIGKATFARGLKERIKALNNPNRHIKQMFQKVDKSVTREKNAALPEDVRPQEPGAPPLTIYRRRKAAEAAKGGANG